MFAIYCVYNVILTSMSPLSRIFADTGAIPTRKTNFTLSIQMDFQLAFNDLNSPQSQEFINTLVLQVNILFSLLHNVIIMASAKEVLFSLLIDVCQQVYTETTQLNLFKLR